MNARLLPALVVSAALLPATALAKDKPEKGKDGDGVLPPPQVTGLMQVWGTAWDQDENPVTDPASYGDPEDDPGFKIRRARIGIEGKDKDAGTRYGVTFGFSSGYDAVGGPPDTDIQIIDASGGVRPVKGLWIDAGVVKVPVSRAFLMSASELALADRPVGSNWMIPPREVGVLLDGRVGSDDGIRGRGRVGVFNGNGSLVGDDNPGKLVAALLEGIVGPGDVYKTYGAVDGFTLGFAGDISYSADLSTTTLRYGGDVMMRVAGLAVLLEGHMATLEPANQDLQLPGTLATTPRLGTVAQVGYTVGSWEPVARFSSFDDHREFQDNGDVALAEGGVAWHSAKDQIRAGAMFVHRMELQGQAADNDTARLWMQMRL